MRWLIDPVFNAVPALEFLQFLPEKIPYELIGRLIVLIALVITVVFGVGIVFGVTAYVWMKFWFAISNLMWRGYDVVGPGCSRTYPSSNATAPSVSRMR